MNVRPTSAIAYRQIEEEGLLGKKQFEVYEVFHKYGPQTAAEVYEKLQQKYQGWYGDQRGNIRARVNELFNYKVLEEVGTKVCPITGKEAIIWCLNEQLPKKFVKPPSRTELIVALCNQVEAMNTHLTSQWEKLPEKWKQWHEVSKNLLVQCSKYRKKSNRN